MKVILIFKWLSVMICLCLFFDFQDSIGDSMR